MFRLNKYNHNNYTKAEINNLTEENLKSLSVWGRRPKCVNANGSIMNSSYDPHNFPVIVDIPHQTKPVAILP